MEVEDVMLSTIDNPWDPYTHYAEWYAEDARLGYHSPALLARVTISSNELSEYDQELDIVRAIDQIVSENVSGMHRKVTPKTFSKV